MPPSIPLGGITTWSGSIANIPTGYLLCDGTNGTPDLRDKFVVGAALTFAVGQEGGSVNHTHEFTTNTHLHQVLGGTDFVPGGVKNTDTELDPATGTTDPKSNVPPFYSLAYIMHIS